MFNKWNNNKVFCSIYLIEKYINVLVYCLLCEHEMFPFESSDCCIYVKLGFAFIRIIKYTCNILIGKCYLFSLTSGASSVVACNTSFAALGLPYGRQKVYITYQCVSDIYRIIFKWTQISPCTYLCCVYIGSLQYKPVVTIAVREGTGLYIDTSPDTFPWGTGGFLSRGVLHIVYHFEKHNPEI